MKLRTRIKKASKPFIAQYSRAPWWVKVITWLLIALILLPDPFDWTPFIALADEVLYASILLSLLHKYGSVSDENKVSAIDLVKQIIGKSESK